MPNHTTTFPRGPGLAHLQTSLDQHGSSGNRAHDREAGQLNGSSAGKITGTRLLFADEVRVRIVIQWGGRGGTAIKNRTFARNEERDRVQARREGGTAPITGHDNEVSRMPQNVPQVSVVERATLASSIV